MTVYYWKISTKQFEEVSIKDVKYINVIDNIAHIEKVDGTIEEIEFTSISFIEEELK